MMAIQLHRWVKAIQKPSKIDAGEPKIFYPLQEENVPAVPVQNVHLL